MMENVMNEQSIKEAIDELKSSLMDGAEVNDALIEISTDFELREVVLRNRAEKALGDLDTYVERRLARENAMVAGSFATEASRLEQARVVAERVASQYVGRVQDFGKIFEWKGEKFIYVVADGNNRKWKIKAVRVSDSQVFRFNEAAYAVIREHFVKG